MSDAYVDLDLDLCLLAPSLVFSSPESVVDNPYLPPSFKLSVLLRWQFYSLQVDPPLLERLARAIALVVDAPRRPPSAPPRRRSAVTSAPPRPRRAVRAAPPSGFLRRACGGGTGSRSRARRAPS